MTVVTVDDVLVRLVLLDVKEVDVLSCPLKVPGLNSQPIWDFPKIRVPYFGVLILRILLFRVLF